MMNKFRNFFMEEVEEEMKVSQEEHNVENAHVVDEFDEIMDDAQPNEREFVADHFFNPQELEEVSRSVLIEEAKEMNEVDENTKEFAIPEKQGQHEQFKFPLEVEAKPEVKQKVVEKEVKQPIKKSVPVEKKFKPAPVISPVYGIVNGAREDFLTERKEKVKEREIVKSKTKQKLDIDRVREKAFGVKPKEEELPPVFEETIQEDFDTLSREYLAPDPTDIQEVDLDDAQMTLEDDLGMNANEESFFDHLFNEDEMISEEEIFKVSNVTFEEAAESYNDFGMEYDVQLEEKDSRFYRNNPSRRTEESLHEKELKEQMSLFYQSLGDEKKGVE